MKNNSGFTLVEILIVITIISLLITAGMAVFTQAQSKGRDAKRKGDIEAIAKVLESKYNVKSATYPNLSTLASGFTNNQFPVPPKDGDYVVNSDGKAFVACSKLDKAPDSFTLQQCVNSISSGENKEFCYCKTSLSGPVQTLIGNTLSVTTAITVGLSGVNAYVTPGTKQVFVTRETFQGNLGGVSGARSKCQASADSIRLPGRYEAWVSANGDAVKNRSNLSHSNKPYQLVDGTIIANNWGDLTDGTIANFINKDARGEIVEDSAVWSATGPDGGGRGGNCYNWTTVDAVPTGDVGFTSRKDGSWTYTNGWSPCSWGRRLYCFEQ